MGKFTVTHEINCNADTFWKLFFDKTLNETLFRSALDFPKYEINEQRDTETEIIRRVSAQPKMNLPGPVAKVLGSGFSYVEDGRFDKKTKVWSWKMIPSALTDKMRNEGTMRIEPIGDAKVRRIADLFIEVKVFGVGGLMESTGEKQMREGWDHSAVFYNKWIADGKAT
jgi:hypothetical protein